MPMDKLTDVESTGSRTMTAQRAPRRAGPPEPPRDQGVGASLSHRTGSSSAWPGSASAAAPATPPEVAAPAAGRRGAVRSARSAAGSPRGSATTIASAVPKNSQGAPAANVVITPTNMLLGSDRSPMAPMNSLTTVMARNTSGGLTTSVSRSPRRVATAASPQAATNPKPDRKPRCDTLPRNSASRPTPKMSTIPPRPVNVNEEPADRLDRPGRPGRPDLFERPDRLDRSDRPASSGRPRAAPPDVDRAEQTPSAITKRLHHPPDGNLPGGRHLAGAQRPVRHRSTRRHRATRCRR